MALPQQTGKDHAMTEHIDTTALQNDTDETGRILLPLPPKGRWMRVEMEIYVRFMRHLRCVPTSRAEVKILSSIQFTSDMLDHSDAHVSKILVDLGLRAPRMAFPADFLEYTDNALLRKNWEFGGAGDELIDLQNHWDMIGEDKFARFKKKYTLLDEEVYADR